MSGCLYFGYADVVYDRVDCTVLKLGISGRSVPFARFDGHAKSKANPFRIRFRMKPAASIHFDNVFLARRCETVIRARSLEWLRPFEPGRIGLTVVKLGHNPSGEWLMSSSTNSVYAVRELFAHAHKALSVESEVKPLPLFNGALNELEALQERWETDEHEKFLYGKAPVWTR